MRRLAGPAAAARGPGAGRRLLDSRVWVVAQGALLAMVSKKSGEPPLTPEQRIIFISISVGLTLLAGLMSGLTLGLMSMDSVDLEVLRRSGTPRERRYAAGILPLVQRQHFLLVTLLLCNAVAMEALPLFLDRLADPVTAIAISVTAVLLFGEIIPQALCSRYGLAVGYYSAWLVRLLMVLTSPISWPLAKLLDCVLGKDHKVMFRRTQLKALVDIHAAEEGLGGNLTADEIKVICGALDLTSKTARTAMTPLSKVFMLSAAARLDRATMESVLASGHSRVPVHREGDRTDLIGLIIVKELLQYKVADAVPVAQVRTRSLPRLSADTPMYDLLKLFQTGRSHMVVLTDSHSRAASFTAGTALAAAAAAGGTGPTRGGSGGSGAPMALARVSSGPAPFPELLPDGQEVAVGIITIEDVIEELMQAEIVDETDQFVDNERSIRVNPHALAAALPAALRASLQAGGGPQGTAGMLDGRRAGTGGGRAAAAVAIAAAAAAAGNGAAPSVGGSVGAGGFVVGTLGSSAGGAGAGSGGGAAVLVKKTSRRLLGELAGSGGGSGRRRVSGDGGGGGGSVHGGAAVLSSRPRTPLVSGGDELTQPLLGPDEGAPLSS